MTNAEAIETLRANYPDACYEQLREAVDKAIKVLEAQEWILCSERLPKDEIAYYLVTLVDYSQLTYRDRDTDIARWDYDRRKGLESWHWCKEREVIAWMPLPEPYRGEGK